MNSYTLTQYSNAGEQLASSQVSLDQLDAETLAQFSKKLSRLSGDLDLPLEAKLPGEFPHLDYRIGSDGHGAYVLFYLHDEVVFASLYLRGVDEPGEIELMQVFKFLLLDTDDADEPTEEEIEAVLAADEFNFESIDQRPAVFTIRFSQNHDEEAELKWIESMNQYLAAAFLAR